MLAEHWQFIAPIASVPDNDQDLDRLIHFLDGLLDAIGENEQHSLMGLVDLISTHIETYENERFQQSLGNGIEALKFLMKTQEIIQSDLPEIGSQGVVSEILNGKRELNRGQIERLAKRFGVSPATFI
jgi:HTH-type transcriptional regulator/antitoxin HigA